MDYKIFIFLKFAPAFGASAPQAVAVKATACNKL
jgi:hypothetical protein